MSQCDAMTSLTWLYDVTKLTLSILACRWATQMVRCLFMYGCLGCLIRKCHNSTICMMTSLHALTSWSWRPRHDIKNFISLIWACLYDTFEQYFVYLVIWHLDTESILVLLQFRKIAWRHLVTSWRDIVTCWRQLAKIVSIICSIPTTQITIAFE